MTEETKEKLELCISMYRKLDQFEREMFKFAIEQIADTGEAPKRKRGRPVGSRSKPKVAAEAQANAS